MVRCERSLPHLTFHVRNSYSLTFQTKEELVSALPELSVAVNGIAWLLSTTPVILLEHTSSGMGVSKLTDDGLSFEMKMYAFRSFLLCTHVSPFRIRDFICLSKDLSTPAESAVNQSPTRVPGDVNIREESSLCLDDAQAADEASSGLQNDSVSNHPSHGSCGLVQNEPIAEDPTSTASDSEFGPHPPSDRFPPVLPSQGMMYIPHERSLPVVFQPKDHLRFSPGKTERKFQCFNSCFSE